MPLTQVVMLTGNDGRSFFMIWVPDQEEFLSLGERTQWADWNQFKAIYARIGMKPLMRVGHTRISGSGSTCNDLSTMLHAI